MEDANIYVCDTAAGSVKINAPVLPVVHFLEQMYSVYRTFGVHVDSVCNVDQAVNNLNSVLNYLQEGQATLKAQSDVRVTSKDQMGWLHPKQCSL